MDAETAYWTVAGLTFAALAGLFVFEWDRRRRRLTEVYENESGTVQITRCALLEFVREAVGLLPSIRAAQVSMQLKQGVPMFTVKVVTGVGHSLRHVTGHVQETVRNVVCGNLGFEKVERVDVILTHVEPGFPELPAPEDDIIRSADSH